MGPLRAELEVVERFLLSLGIVLDEDMKFVEVRLTADAVVLVWLTDEWTRLERTYPVVWS